MKTGLVFSGQGSQYVGMLRDIAADNPAVGQKLDLANEILGFDMKNMMFEGGADVLRETRHTQPALYLHSAINFDLVKNGLEFHGVAGHSVGEYAALYAAGVISFEDGLRLVAKRGHLMFSSSRPGTMFAVVGLDDGRVAEVCEGLNKGGDEVIVPANFNSPGQVVVSGSADYLRQNAPKFKEAGAKLVKELEVSGAFHSPLMEPAKLELEKVIRSTGFNDPSVPIYVNVTAQAVDKAEDIKDMLVAQLTGAVLWTKIIENMSGDGFVKFIEIGPGKVLQGLIKRINTAAELQGVDNLAEVKSMLS